MDELGVETIFMIIAQMIAAYIGTVAFSALFNVSEHNRHYCALTGLVGWVVYIFFINISLSTTLSSFISVVALAIFARYLSVIRKAPSTIFLICGIFPIVPGTHIYFMTYNLLLDQIDTAFFHGGEAIKIALAISLGICVTFSIPNKFFGWSVNGKGR